MQELILKKCENCGSIVKVIEEGSNSNCKIVCCDSDMKTIVANSTDASVEKHVPHYEVIGDNIKISVNHVMEEDHYIEWILVKSENNNYERLFKYNENIEFIVPYIRGSIIYSYCNKHGLWQKNVE